MDKSKISPEILAKILREHAEMLSHLSHAPETMSTEEWKTWSAKKKEILSKIKKIDVD